MKCDGRTYYKACIQVNWLNIITPSPSYTGVGDVAVDDLQQIDNITDLKASFAVTEESASATDKIIFNLYAPKAEISTPDSWITLDQTEVQHDGKALSCQFTVNFTTETNSTGADRTGKIVITTSNGVTTEIAVTQKG